jgi:hypothetical protein
MGGEAIVVLLGMDRTTLSPEQLARVDEICGSAKPVSAEQAKSLRKNISFVLNCLASQNRALRGAGLQALRDVTGKSLVFDVNADAPTRAAALDRLRDQLVVRTAP